MADWPRSRWLCLHSVITWLTDLQMSSTLTSAILSCHDWLLARMFTSRHWFNWHTGTWLADTKCLKTWFIITVVPLLYITNIQVYITHLNSVDKVRTTGQFKNISTIFNQFLAPSVPRQWPWKGRHYVMGSDGTVPGDGTYQILFTDVQGSYMNDLTWDEFPISMWCMRLQCIPKQTLASQTLNS